VFWLSPLHPEPEEGPPWTHIGGHLANCVPLERGNGAGGVAPQTGSWRELGKTPSLGAGAAACNENRLKAQRMQRCCKSLKPEQGTSKGDQANR
jgi:hypothetical protein